MPAPLNVVYLHSHDTGRHIQPYGHAIPTPHLQELAESGALFRQAFCAGPTCSPSRAALLTGTSPHVNGMIGLRHRGFSLSDSRLHLAVHLRKHGFQTASYGMEHVSDGMEPPLWDVRDELQKSGGRERNSVALDWLARRDPSAPFFLSLGYFETHREFPEPGPACDARYVQPPACLPDTPETRADMAAFQQMARDFDGHVGEFLAGLRAQGLLENTLIICTTDHGIAFPRMKCNLQDTGIGVMLMLAGPGIAAGTIVESMVTHMDIYPTICEFTGVPRPDWLEGSSLWPLLRGEIDRAQPDALHEEIYAEVTYHAAYEPMRCVRTPRWKYIRRYEGATRTVSTNCDDSPSKSLWLNADWRARTYPEEALYDLLFDPMEAGNLAASPDHAPILDDLRDLLQDWMRRTDDPLLSGSVPLPPGARVDGPG